MDEDSMTVEQFLTRHCDLMIADLRKHGADVIDKLRNEFEQGAEQVHQLLAASLSGKMLVVILKCVGGPHLGQRFRLESSGEGTEETFKVGRSTGRHFKEKGVSLYKDKEISTTHAKIEIRNGNAFLVDLRSTNGTLLNGTQIESAIPFRLKEDDVITFGSTELRVTVHEAEGLENLPPAENSSN
jgi:hypothetical protein